ncbi:MAG: hypothetical protein AAF572_28400 [Cyanobacteria bacterium P01_B01_bin.77]
MDRDRIIEAYIQRLLAWEKPVNQDTLAAISKEVGITPAEMHAVRRQAQAHFTRGRNYIEFGVLNEAIDELTQAMALDPLNLTILHCLANAYNLRYNREQEPADRQKALLVAKRCVELKPNDKEALVLISFLEHTPANDEQKVFQWTKQKIGVVAGGVVTVGLGLMGLSRLPVFSQPPVLLGPAPGTIVPGSAIYESSTPGTSRQEAPVAADIDLSADVEIPVNFEYPGIVLEARLSQVGDYEDAVYYQLHGIFINAGDQEIRQLALKVEFLDQNNVAIAANDTEAIGISDAIIRPGDTHAFNLLQKVTSDLSTVQLSVTTLEQALARNTYVPPTPINYGWDSLEPETISFELASRSEVFGGVGVAAAEAASMLDDAPIALKVNDDASEQAAAEQRQANDARQKQPNTYGFNAEWMLINTGNYPLQKLKLKADFYDANDRRLQSEDVIAISKNDAPLLPGETRPFRVIKSIAKGYERYTVTVLEAE